MIDKPKLGKDVDNSRLMTKLSVLGGVGSLILAVLILVLGIGSTFAGSDSFNLAILPYLLASLFAFSAMIYGLMSTSAGQEDEEKQLLENRKRKKKKRRKRKTRRKKTRRKKTRRKTRKSRY